MFCVPLQNILDSITCRAYVLTYLAESTPAAADESGSEEQNSGSSSLLPFRRWMMIPKTDHTSYVTPVPIVIVSWTISFRTVRPMKRSFQSLGLFVPGGMRFVLHKNGE